ncbi:hypothetical protein ACFX15_017302 [Malus domestica]
MLKFPKDYGIAPSSGFLKHQNLARSATDQFSESRLETKDSQNRFLRLPRLCGISPTSPGLPPISRTQRKYIRVTEADREPSRRAPELGSGRLISVTLPILLPQVIPFQQAYCPRSTCTNLCSSADLTYAA